MNAVSSPFRLEPGGLTVRLRVTPNARRAGVEGIERLADGQAVVRVKVAAPPEDGRANAAVIALLAKRWRLPRRDLTIVAGQTGRLKTLRIAEGDAALQARVADMLDAGAR